VYYYFYERSRETILRSRTGLGGKGLSTLESMLAGLIAGKKSFNSLLEIKSHKTLPGSATTIISNPIWVIQTSQAVHTLGDTVVVKKLGFFETVQNILAKDGLG
jgi:adenine nucleotide transporter 17